jgi:ABC-type transport system involved in multi-copper enzyme maturation permease subunit
VIGLFRLLAARFDALDRRRGFRIAVTVVATLAIAIPFAMTWREGRRLRSDANAIMATLAVANLAAKDAAAVQFAEAGTVTLDAGTPRERTLGDPALAATARRLYDESGRLLDASAAASVVLAATVPAWMPTFLIEQPSTTAATGLLCLVAALGTIWGGLLGPALLIALASLGLALPFWLGGRLAPSLSVLGIGGLALAFLLLVRLASWLLSGPNPLSAIAANVLRESLRLRIAAFFIGGLVVLLPLLPLWISRDDPLRYQIQTYLSNATGLTFLFAACMTVFLSAATVAFEIRDRQIWQVLTKPVARLQYLLGKWAGTVALNLILLAVAGGATLITVQAMRTRPAVDALDAAAVREEVLAARTGSYPQYRRLGTAELDAAVQAALAKDPLLRAELEDGQRDAAEVEREQRKRILTEHLAQQRTVPPGEERAYSFTGLSAAKRLGGNVSLRYSFDIVRMNPHETHPVIFKFRDGYYADRMFVPSQAHVLPVPAELIDDDGTLTVTIENAGLVSGPEGVVKAPGEGPLLFKADSLEVLWRAGEFEANFVRAQLVNLVKLSFLAMLGVATATFLSFPVATLLCFTVLAIGSLSPFLSISIEDYVVSTEAPILQQVLQVSVRTIARVAEWLLRAFGETGANRLVVEGRLVPWSALVRTVAVIGVAWTGLAFVAGFLAFRRKEIAIYSGQG